MPFQAQWSVAALVAASLEETAAALDQITTNVANSSKRTEEARHVAIEGVNRAGFAGDRLV